MDKIKVLFDYYYYVHIQIQNKNPLYKGEMDEDHHYLFRRTHYKISKKHYYIYALDLLRHISSSSS